MNDVLSAIPYRTVVADPPWQPTLHANNARRKTRDKAGPQKFYPTMSLDEIAAIKPTLSDQAHIYIWGINAHFDWTYVVMREWGGEPVTILTWNKPGLGVGRFQCNTEHILVGRVGKALGNPFGREGRTQAATGGTRFDWPRGRHSEKPKEFFDLVEKLSPEPRLEMYARDLRPGWSVFGNQIATPKNDLAEWSEFSRP